MVIGKCGAEVKKIIVNRAEGPHELTGKKEFKGKDVIDRADMFLIEISGTAPKSGGYDKTDVIIELDNGTTFKSRHDIKFGDIDDTTLRHAERFQDFIASCEFPDKEWKHMDADRHKRACLNISETDVRDAKIQRRLLRCLIEENVGYELSWR